MKKTLTAFMLLFMIFLTACQGENYGVIKNFYIEDSVMHWTEIRSARYYKLSFYTDDSFTNVLMEDIAYTNEWDGLTIIDDGTPINLIIEAYKSEVDSSFSDQISFIVDKEYPNPYCYIESFNPISVVWDSLEDLDGFRNYTINYNDIPISSGDNSISVQDDSVLLAFNVTANFDDGTTSKTSPTVYVYSGLPITVINVAYDLDSNDDLEIDFQNYADILAITNHYTLLKDYYDSPSDVYWVETETIVINQFFIQANYSDMIQTSNTKDFVVITDTIVYYINITA